jgi:hypothetical protein
MTPLLALVLALVLAFPAAAQMYSRCVDSAGKVYITEDARPTGVHCVGQVTKELKETPLPVEKVAAYTAGAHSLWITEATGTILVGTYQSEEACRIGREARVAAAAQRAPLDVIYRCLPAGTRP